MKEYFSRLLLLPRKVRTRMMMSFALMGVIPLLTGVYAVTVHITDRKVSDWLSIVLLICIILACLGFIIMRATIWSVIDVFNTMDAELPPHGSSGATSLSDEEIVQFERLIIYMENQIHQARNRLREYRGSSTAPARFRLPPLVPRDALRQRITQELDRAESNRYPLSLFMFKEHEPSAEHMIDESRLPAWLDEILRKSFVTFDGIGLWHDGQWLLWMRKQTNDDAQSLKNRMSDLLPPVLVNRITIRAWNHPLQGMSSNDILNTIDAFGTES